jgi:hypothetical protein
MDTEIQELLAQSHEVMEAARSESKRARKLVRESIELPACLGRPALAPASGSSDASPGIHIVATTKGGLTRCKRTYGWQGLSRSDTLLIVPAVTASRHPPFRVARTSCGRRLPLPIRPTATCRKLATLFAKSVLTSG